MRVELGGWLAVTLETQADGHRAGISVDLLHTAELQIKTCNLQRCGEPKGDRAAKKTCTKFVLVPSPPIKKKT